MKKLGALLAALICVMAGVSVVVVMGGKGMEDQPGVISISDNMFYHALQAEMVENNPESGGKYVKNELIVEAGGDVSKADMEALFHSLGGALVGFIAETNTYQVAFDEDITYSELKAMEQALGQDPRVAYAQVNQVFDCQSSGAWYVPNDPVGSDNWAFEAIEAPAAWQEYLSKNIDEPVNVGIFDVSGVDANHEDLKDNFAHVPMFNGNELDHGTLVAGIIGAGFDNGIGTSGMVPHVQLDYVGYARLDHDMETLSGDAALADIMTYKVALTYLIADCKSRVINVSMGLEVCALAGSRGDEAAKKELDSINFQLEYTLTRLLERGHDFLICKAAGNSNEVDDPSRRAAYIKADKDDKNAVFGYIKVTPDNKDILKKYTQRPNYAELVDYGNVDAQYDIFSGIRQPDIRDRIIVVGSVSRVDGDIRISGFSCGGSRVDLVAPGDNIRGLAPGNGYTDKAVWGTSFSAPYVTGAAALVFALNPGLTGPEVKDILLDTAANRYPGYLDGQQYDCGLLDAFQAVKEAGWREAHSGNDNGAQTENPSEAQTETVTEAASIELTQYLQNYIADVINGFDSMEDEYITSGGVGYTNGKVTFEAADTVLIDFISIRDTCDYMIEGISYGEDCNGAIESLQNSSWALKQQTTQYWLFVNNLGDELSLYSDNGQTITMIRYRLNEEYVVQSTEAPEDQTEAATEPAPPDTEPTMDAEDIYNLLTAHYQPNGETVMEGELAQGVYSTSVRTGVPGNPTASQRIYEIEVDVATGMVSEWNVFTNETILYKLY